MKRRIKKLLAAALVPLCLAGCSGINNDVEDLLTAPRTGADQTAITQVLATASGAGSVKLKYPRSGVYLSPFLFVDLDEDGRNEAVTFYVDEAVSKNVRVALLDEKEEGEWRIVSDAEGFGTDIDRVLLCDLVNGEGLSLVVGYASTNMSEKRLAIYDCLPGGLSRLYDQSYSQFLAADVTGSGVDELAVVSAAGMPGALTLSLVTIRADGAAQASVFELDERLQSCTGLQAADGGLLVDGLIAGEETVTDVLAYERWTGLASCSKKVGKDLLDLTGRSQQLLRSRDMNGDGEPEVPVVLGSVRDTEGRTRWLWVSYFDFFTAQPYENDFASAGQALPYLLEKEEQAAPQATQTPAPETEEEAPALAAGEIYFGVLDLDYDCYLPLPAEWKGSVQLRMMPGDDWCIVDAADPEQRLLIFQIADAEGDLSPNAGLYGRPADYLSAGRSNGRKLYLYATPESGVQTAAVLQNVSLLS